MNINDLPAEILGNILFHVVRDRKNMDLTKPDLTRSTASVCKRWREIVNTRTLWNHFGLLTKRILKANPGTKAHDLYKAAYNEVFTKENEKLRLKTSIQQGIPWYVQSRLPEIGTETELNSDNGMKAIHFAAVEGDKDMIELTLKLGANVSSTTQSGFPAIHYTTLHEHLEAYSTLLLYKANPYSKESSAGKSAIFYATEKTESIFLKLNRMMSTQVISFKA